MAEIEAGDKPGDTVTGHALDRDDVTWMSYAELGTRRGISAASAKRLAIRRHWQRRLGNDGTARVAVPVTDVTPEDNAGDAVTRVLAALEAVFGDRARADAATIEALADQVHVLQADLDRRRTEAHEAANRIQVLIGRADVADLARQRAEEAAAGRVEASEAGRATAEQARQRAEEALAGLETRWQAETVSRRSLGRLARLLAAWRGD